MGGRGKITIRDGRIGRDPEQVTEDGFGAVLGTTEGEPLDIGDKVRLADGTDVFVIGTKENIGRDTWEQIVSVGDLPDRRPPQQDAAG